MDKSLNEEHLSQSLKTNSKQFEVAITFLTGHNGIYNVTSNTIKLFSANSITDKDGFIQPTIPPGAYEIANVNNEIKRIAFEESLLTEVYYSFTIKPDFSTLGSIIESSGQEPLISFTPNDSVLNNLSFDAITIYEEYNLLLNPVNILSSDNIFPETYFAQRMNFAGKRSGLIHNFTMDVDPGCNYIEKFRGGLSCYLMESQFFLTHISFKLKIGTSSLNLLRTKATCQPKKSEID